MVWSSETGGYGETVEPENDQSPVVNPRDQDNHENLISLLSRLGEGHDGVVNQSLVQLSLSLAFKAPRQLASIQGNKKRPLFNEMATEISILSLPLVRQSQNVINLEGISWTIHEDHTAWPVFVYRKGTLLRHYLLAEQTEGRLTPQRKLDICVGIGHGLAALHASGVVHADLKPGNIILVGDDEHLTPKIADLRLSVVGSDTEERKLPHSYPWTAPEHHPRHWQIDHARRMDVFSFGLICFWILSWDRIFHEVSEGEEASEIERLKGPENDMVLLMKEVDETIREMELDESSQNVLQEFFRRTLSVEPAGRGGNANELIPLLTRSERPTPETSHTGTPEVSTTDHCNFQVLKSMAQLTMADFRARQQVFEGLRQIASESCCGRCKENATFQLALCSELAFGTPRSHKITEMYLSQIERDVFSLQSELENIDHACNPTNDIRTLPDDLQGDLVHEYQIRNDLAEASLHLDREIKGRCKVLGNEHPLVTCLQSNLVHVYEAMGQRTQAQSLQEEILRANKSYFGEFHAETLAAMAQLLLLYDENGQPRMAVEKGEELVQSCKAHLGPTNRTTMSVMANLAKAYMAIEQWETAERLQEETCNLFDTMLGSEHPETLKCLSNLAVLYRFQPEPKGELEGDIRKRLAEARNAVYGDLPHRDSLMFQHLMLGSERSAIDDTKSLDHMLDRLKNLYENSKTYFTRKQPDSWLLAVHLAAAEADLGKIDSAMKVFNEAKKNLERILGPSHALTIQIMIKFAEKCQNHGKYEESNELLQEVFKRDSKGTREVTDRTLQAMYLLGKSYLDHGQEQKAQKIWEDVMRISMDQWGVDIEFTPCRLSMAFLPNIYIKDGKPGMVKKGLELHERLVRWHVDHLGDRREQTIAAKSIYAEGLLKVERYADAMEILQSILPVSKQELGPTHDVTRAVRFNMASGFNRQGNPREAARIAKELVDIQKALLGPSDEDTLLSMSNLAFYHSAMGEHEKARDIGLEVLCVHESKPMSFARFLAMHNLADSYESLHEPEKAIDIQYQLLEEQRAFYEGDHREIYETVYALALSLSDIPERLEEALKTARESLAFFETRLGLYDRYTIYSAGLIGWILKEQGEVKQARQMFEKELEGSRNMDSMSKDEYIQHALKHLAELPDCLT